MMNANYLFATVIISVILYFGYLLTNAQKLCSKADSASLFKENFIIFLMESFTVICLIPSLVDL